MSLGDDGYGGDSRSGRPDDGYSTLGGTRQTRTRFADGTGGDGYGSRRPARSSRSLTMVVGVVVLLVAAIAFANMGGGRGDSDSSGGSSGGKAGAAPTAASGTKPVTGKNGNVPAGFAHDEQGAQSAATNYAVALGSAEMFNATARRGILQATHDPAVVERLQTDLDKAYSASLFKNVGLNEDGSTPSGLTFVSRTVPVGTKVIKQSNARHRRGLVYRPCRNGRAGIHQARHRNLVHHHRETEVGRERLEDRVVQPDRGPDAGHRRQPGIDCRRHRWCG